MKANNHTRIFLLLAFYIVFAFCQNSTSPPDAAPVINGITSSSINSGFNEVVSVHVDVIDKDKLTFRWTCDGGIFLTGITSDSFRVSETTIPDIDWFAPSTKGSYTIDVAVTDRKDTVSTSTKLTVNVVFFDDFSKDLSKWTTYNCQATIEIGKAKLEMKGTTPENPVGGLCHSFMARIPLPYTLEMKVMQAALASIACGYGPYICVKDSNSAAVYKIAFLICPRAGTINWSLEVMGYQDPMYSDIYYTPLASGKSSSIPTELNKWADVIMKVDINKVLTVRVNNTHVMQYDLKGALGAASGQLLDMSLIKVGCDNYSTGISISDALKVDDVLVDSP